VNSLTLKKPRPDIFAIAKLGHGRGLPVESVDELAAVRGLLDQKDQLEKVNKIGAEL
jgi:hypothetical protein